jgi:NifU-like domain
MTQSGDKGFHQRIQRVEALLQEIQTRADPAMRAAAEELVGAILDFHGRGLERIAELLSGAGCEGQALLRKLAGDELVSSLFLLYDLHPLELENRVRQAVERLGRQRGLPAESVGLLGVHDSVVRLHVESGGHGCQSSARTIRQTIEEAICAAAPEITRVEIEGLPEPVAEAGTTFVPVDALVQRLQPAAAAAR